MSNFPYTLIEWKYLDFNHIILKILFSVHTRLTKQTTKKKLSAILWVRVTSNGIVQSHPRLVQFRPLHVKFWSEKCTSKNRRNSFICQPKKRNKNSESKVICDTHLKRNIFNRNRIKHEKNGKQIVCPSWLRSPLYPCCIALYCRGKRGYAGHVLDRTRWITYGGDEGEILVWNEEFHNEYRV